MKAYGRTFRATSQSSLVSLTRKAAVWCDDEEHDAHRRNDDGQALRLCGTRLDPLAVDSGLIAVPPLAILGESQRVAGRAYEIGTSAARWAIEAKNRAHVGSESLQCRAQLDARGVGDADHSLEIRCHSCRVNHRCRAQGLHHRRPRHRQGFWPPHNVLSKRQKFSTLRNTASQILTGNHSDIGTLTAPLAARPEQPGMGAGSIETIVKR